tara:strand:- start:925 stop:1659 length:735 start_codon:yes stop_codon:yes gene_type:complete
MTEIWKKTRFRLGTFVRILSSPFYESTASLDESCTIFASGFGDSGWHHIRKTLEEYDENPSIKPKETTIWNFLKNFQPLSINKLASVELENDFDLFDYPWGSCSQLVLPNEKSVLQSRFCGPSKIDFINKEFYRTINLYKKIMNEGYNPNTYPHRHVTGTWLISDTGEKRFIVMSGNHRTAILAHLGYKKIKVRTSSSSIRLVNESDINTWKYVKSKFCKVGDAKQIFDFFFENNGYHIRDLIE